MILYDSIFENGFDSHGRQLLGVKLESHGLPSVRWKNVDLWESRRGNEFLCRVKLGGCHCSIQDIHRYIYIYIDIQDDSIYGPGDNLQHFFENHAMFDSRGIG